MANVSSRIKELRIKYKLNQSELGNKINVGKTTISNWETGYSCPDMDSIIKLAEIFLVTTDYILGRTNNPKESLVPPEEGQILITKALNANVSIEELEAYIEAREKTQKKNG